MNYELLSKIAMKESDELRKEIKIFHKRDQILTLEIKNLKQMISLLEKEKIDLRTQKNDLKEQANKLISEKLMQNEKIKNLETEIKNLKRDFEYASRLNNKITPNETEIHTKQDEEEKKEIPKRQGGFEFYS